MQGITGHAVYTLPIDHFEVLSIIYYPDELDEEPVHALNIALSWRMLSTRPKWWTVEVDPIGPRLRVMPTPTVTGVAPRIIGLTSFQPTTDDLVILPRKVPADTDLRSWVDGVLAYHVTAREPAGVGSRLGREGSGCA